MALQFSVGVRNAWLNNMESTIGVSAVLQIYSGAPPANTAAAATGTLLAEIQLDSDWLAAAASGAASVQVVPNSDLNANAAGTAGHFRLLESTKTTVHIQGIVTVTGGGGDMEIDNTSIALNQQVDLTSWTFTAPGA